jgi:hypothetical protein
MLLVVTVLTLGLASFAVAQMMGGNHGHKGNMPMGQNDTLSQSATMGTGHMMGTMPSEDSLVSDMSQYCQMMSNDFDKLQSHFDKMMKIDDMKSLKAEMQKHHDMMVQMHQSMNREGNMVQNMMSMMHSGHMQGMMDPDANQTTSNN